MSVYLKRVKSRDFRFYLVLHLAEVDRVPEKSDVGFVLFDRRHYAHRRFLYTVVEVAVHLLLQMLGSVDFFVDRRVRSICSVKGIAV